MDYGASDSSGTDDDLPPSHQNRGVRGGRVTGNGRPIVNAHQYPRAQNDMEAQIHRLEQEAYSSVLRAFKGQADAITWEKESLITELRKELRVSDDEHRELLGRVNADDVIRRIREWRQTGAGFISNAQSAHDPVPSPTVSASRKRQKTGQSLPSLSLGAPSPALHSQPFVASMQPSSSAVKRGAASGSRGKKMKPGQLPGVSSMKSMPTGPSGKGQVPNKNSSGALVAIEPAEVAQYDPLIGRKVMTRWPADNNFYEAVITDYNPSEGRHALVYDINTKDETWEWVDLKEISPEDIRWEGEDPGIAHQVGRGGPGRGFKKTLGRGVALPNAGRGRGTIKTQSKKEFPPSQNGTGKKNSNDIEILHTETLLKEVEKVFSSAHPDPLELEKAKKTLKEHEQSLIEALTRLVDISDGESDGEHQFSDRDRGWRNQPYTGNQHGANYEEGVGGDGGDGYAGDRVPRHGVASDFRHDVDDM